MITMTLSEALNIAPILQEISMKTFSGAITFKIARLIRELNKEIQLFELERDKIAQKYGEKDGNGNLIILENGTVKIPDNLIKECNEELQALLTTQFEINANKLPFEIFESIEMTPAQAMEMISIVDFE